MHLSSFQINSHHALSQIQGFHYKISTFQYYIPNSFQKQVLKNQCLAMLTLAKYVMFALFASRWISNLWKG